MKALFTLLSLLSLTSVFAADPACSDSTNDQKVTVRKCTNAAACTADKGPDASFKDGICYPSLQVSTNCPQGVEANRSAVVDKSDKATGAETGSSQKK